MGLRKWIANKIIGRRLKNMDNDRFNILAGEFLSRSQKKYSNTLATAEKLNKANLFNIKERELRDELKEGLDDDDLEEEEEEEENFLENPLVQELAKKFLLGEGDKKLDLKETFESLPTETQDELKQKFLGV